MLDTSTVLRTAIYIDGYNLYYGRLRGTQYKWLDVVALFSRITRSVEPHSQIIYVKFFTAPALPKLTSRLFIKGPIPFDWLQKANSLGGSTGIVGIGLWFYVGISGSKYFKVDSKLDRFTGVSRQTRQSALQRLQSAGLIKYWNRHGGYPLVEVLIAP